LGPYRIADGILEARYLAIILFGNFNAKRFVNPLNPAKNVHRVQVELISQISVVLDFLIDDVRCHVR
jgi:hypothetical protein